MCVAHQGLFDSELVGDEDPSPPPPTALTGHFVGS